jgi:hypothetical protein
MSVDHFSALERAYEAVGRLTWSRRDFLDSRLEASRNLFEPTSLVSRTPQPKELEVVALVSGIPFAQDFANALVDTQRQLSGVLGDCLHYWVAPENFGVEYCVFKWPEDTFDDKKLAYIKNALASCHFPSYRFRICGVQINPDGCVVAKGFDEESVIFRVREQLKAEISFLPEKQSGWAHVPLGRIMEPSGPPRFAKLAQLMSRMVTRQIAATDICSMKLVHETRWYMEQKTVLAEYPLSANSGSSEQ